MRRIEKVEFETFDLDENKRLLTLAKSGLDLRVVAFSLLTPHVEQESPRDGEPRIKAVCMFDGRLIVVIYTKRDGVCRLISAWPADKNEQRQYRKILGG
jgi:uncharacterized DUF497 family protein